jgi:hypothetical protein
MKPTTQTNVLEICSHQPSVIDGIMMSSYRPEYDQQAIPRIRITLDYTLLHAHESSADPLTKYVQLGLVQCHVHRNELHVVWYNRVSFTEYASILEKGWRVAARENFVQHYLFVGGDIGSLPIDGVANAA